MSLELLGAQDLTPAPESDLQRRRAWRRVGVAVGGSLLGLVAWPKHWLLGALAGGTLADNAHGLATGEITWTEAGKSVALQGMSIGAALAVPAHPAAAYVLTNIAAHAVLDPDGLRALTEDRREVIDVRAVEEPRLLAAPAQIGCWTMTAPGLVPGWGCCQCRTYNGNQRDACKHCGHRRCAEGSP